MYIGSEEVTLKRSVWTSLVITLTVLNYLYVISTCVRKFIATF